MIYYMFFFNNELECDFCDLKSWLMRHKLLDQQFRHCVMTYHLVIYTVLVRRSLMTHTKCWNAVKRRRSMMDKIRRAFESSHWSVCEGQQSGELNECQLSRDGASSLWSRITKTPDVSTGPLTRPFARSLAPLTHLLAPHNLFHSRAPLRSLARSIAHSLSQVPTL